MSLSVTKCTQFVKYAQLMQMPRIGSARCVKNISEIPKSYWTKKDAARELRVCERTLCEWMNKGMIPFYKIGRTVRLERAEVVAALGNFRGVPVRRSKNTTETSGGPN